jgi:hypothetical protein
VTARFSFTLPDGSTVVGPVRGAGGFVSSELRMLAAERCARIGRPTGIYEPRPGFVAVYPDFSARDDGAPVFVKLASASWRLVTDATTTAEVGT